MQKRAQITTFIVIGIIILAVVGLVLYFRNLEVQTLPHEAVPEDVKPIQLFVEECIQKSAVPGIYYLGEQGGYIFPPADAFTTDIHTIAYGFKDKNGSLPSIEEMQSQLSDYLRIMLPICTDKFSIFSKEGITVEEGNISVNTNIFQDRVVFMVNYPLKIIKNQKESKMLNFMANVPVNLGKDYNIASRIVNEQRDGVTLNQLIFPDVKVNLMPVGAGTMVFGILDEKSVLNNRTFLFMFAYELNENRNPQLEYIYNPVFESGKPVEMQVSAEDPDDDPLKYSTNSTEFPINPSTGEININAPAKGYYNVMIKAEDGNGGIDEQEVIFSIV